MRVVGTLAFALVVLVSSTFCFNWGPKYVGSGLSVRKLNIQARHNIYYKKYAFFGPRFTFHQLLGEFSFLERDGLIVGWGEDNKPIRAMYGANGKPFIMDADTLSHLEREEWQMAGYGIGQPMPPYYSGKLGEF